MEETKVGDVWANSDFSSYLRKIPEKEGFKRFYAHDVPEMVKFLKDIGAEDISNEEFEEVVQKVVEPVKLSYEQIPKEVQIIVGTNLDSSKMPEDFKKRWRELEIKYYNYTIKDFWKEIEENNKRRRKERGIKEDINEDDEADADFLKSLKRDIELGSSLKVRKSKKSKTAKVKPVKVNVSPVKTEFKKKTFKIKAKTS